MKCRDCPDYKKCSSAYDLRIIRKKCEKAKWRKSITNYDRIISKSPEELAVWLAQQEYRRPRFDGWLPLCNHVMGPRTCHKDGCEKCWLDWLRQEVEDGDV